MSTPELSFATPAELIAALPHLLGFIPTNDIVALMLGPAHHQAEVPLRAAIRCPASIELPNRHNASRPAATSLQRSSPAHS